MVEPNVFTSAGNHRFGYNGQEKSDEIAGEGNHNTAEFWEYDTRSGRRWNLDPKPDAWESPYVAFANNPIIYSDILGDTEDQRKKAVEKAREYVAKNPGGKNGSPFGYSPKGDKSTGAKGNPGKAVDCSGMVSKCILASGLPDPVADPNATGNGVLRIAKASELIEDINKIEVGNIVTFNTTGSPTSHIGIVTEVIRNENGELSYYKVIQSGSSTGPLEVNIGGPKPSKYYTSKVSGVFKWDDPEPAKDNQVENTTNTNTNGSTVKHDPKKQEPVKQDNTRVNQEIVPPKK